MKLIKLSLAGAILLLFAACATEYQPDTTVELDTIHEFSGKGAVNLINGQPSTDRQFFFRKFYANPNDWTNAAIKIASRELTKRGLSVRTDTPKSLTLSVESAKSDTGWVKITSDITMIVRTSTGYTKTYTGTDSSVMFGNPRTEMDTALMRVVAAMLDDPQIVAFLTR